MKFKIDVELDWVGEEGNLDDQIQAAIVNKVVTAVSAGITKEATEQAKELIGPKVNALVEQTYNDLIASKIVLTDKWGDKKQEFESIRELIKARWDNFLNELVDKDGREYDGYGSGQMKRVDFFIKEQLRVFADKWTKEALESITLAIKNTVGKELKTELGERLSKVLNIDNLIQKQVR